MRAGVHLLVVILLAGCTQVAEQATRAGAPAPQEDPFRACGGELACADLRSSTYELTRCIDALHCASPGHLLVRVDAKIANGGSSAFGTSLPHFELRSSARRYGADSATSATESPMRAETLRAGEQRTGAIVFHVPIGTRIDAFCYVALPGEEEPAQRCAPLGISVDVPR